MSSADGTDPRIEQLREELSDNDLRIVEAVNVRLELVARLKRVKEERGIDFLDPAREGGVHWRTRLLRIAKAPFLLLALVDVIVGQQRAYAITSKVAPSGRPAPTVLVAFAPTSALIAAAWIAGAATSTAYPVACHVSAALALTVCIGLMVSEFLPVTAPFDARLIPRVN